MDAMLAEMRYHISAYNGFLSIMSTCCGNTPEQITAYNPDPGYHQGMMFHLHMAKVLASKILSNNLMMGVVF